MERFERWLERWLEASAFMPMRRDVKLPLIGLRTWFGAHKALGSSKTDEGFWAAI